MNKSKYFDLFIAINQIKGINLMFRLSNAYIVHQVVRAEAGGLKVFEIGEKCVSGIA